MVSPSIIILKCKSSTHISPLSASPPHLHRHHSSYPVFTLLPVKYSDCVLSLSAQFSSPLSPSASSSSRPLYNYRKLTYTPPSFPLYPHVFAHRMDSLSSPLFPPHSCPHNPPLPCCHSKKQPQLPCIKSMPYNPRKDSLKPLGNRLPEKSD